MPALFSVTRSLPRVVNRRTSDAAVLRIAYRHPGRCAGAVLSFVQADVRHEDPKRIIQKVAERRRSGIQLEADKRRMFGPGQERRSKVLIIPNAMGSLSSY